MAALILSKALVFTLEIMTTATILVILIILYLRISQWLSIPLAVQISLGFISRIQEGYTLPDYDSQPKMYSLTVRRPYYRTAPHSVCQTIAFTVPLSQNKLRILEYCCPCTTQLRPTTEAKEVARWMFSVSYLQDAGLWYTMRLRITQVIHIGRSITQSKMTTKPTGNNLPMHDHRR